MDAARISRSVVKGKSVRRTLNLVPFPLRESQQGRRQLPPVVIKPKSCRPSRVLTQPCNNSKAKSAISNVYCSLFPRPQTHYPSLRPPRHPPLLQQPPFPPIFKGFYSFTVPAL